MWVTPLSHSTNQQGSDFMAHFGNLGSRQVSGDVQDIRGTVLRDSNDQKLGTVDDLIFDHDTMEIRYLVLDSEGWLQGGRFLLPVERVSADRNHEDGLTTDATRCEIKAAQLFPERMADIFSDPAPDSSKVTLKPKSVARAEEAASGVTLLKPRWWESFENYLRENKSDIQGNCSQCNSRAA